MLKQFALLGQQAAALDNSSKAESWAHKFEHNRLQGQGLQFVLNYKQRYLQNFLRHYIHRQVCQAKEGARVYLLRQFVQKKAEKEYLDDDEAYEVVGEALQKTQAQSEDVDN